MWGGDTVLPKTTNAAGFCLLLLAVFILTSILNVNFLAQTISEITGSSEINGAALPPYHLPGNITSAAAQLLALSILT